MSGKEKEIGNENNELKAFEAALASLRPRADRLDDASWRDVLAKEAAMAANSGRLTASGGAPRKSRSFCGLLAPGYWNSLFHGSKPQSEYDTACSDPSGHEFVCIHCGSVAVMKQRRRWVWPTVSATMTAVAAALLMMLAARSEPQVAVREGERDTTMPTAMVAERQNSSDVLAKERSPDSWMAMAGRGRRDSVGDEMPYLALRDQVLRYGVESWKSQASAVAATAKTSTTSEMETPPLNNREQLYRLLEQEGMRGS